MRWRERVSELEALIPKDGNHGEYVCTCGYVAISQKALNGHQLKHKPKVTGYSVSFEPIIDGEKKAER
jgi:hypothetical protein